MSTTNPVILDGHSLTPAALADIARARRAVALAPASIEAMAASARHVAALASGSRPVYGVNTGYGVFADRRIPPADLPELSRNLIRSHAVGVGPPFPAETTRAAIAVRINTLARGLSGVSPGVGDALLALLAHDLIPPIPSQGSLGASGDLAPLAHLGLCLIAPSEIPDDPPGWYGGEPTPWPSGFQQAGLTPLTVGPKDGLALTNGASFSAAQLALAAVDLRRLLAAAEAAAALSFEALCASRAALDPRLHDARPHPGQSRVARSLRQFLDGSTLIDSGDHVQDAYSLRCTPQILGPAWEILEFVEGVIRREINAATDNPLFFDGVAVSGGNFHGQPLGMAADYLKIAVAETGAVSERRTFRLLSEHTSRGLPAMLVATPARTGLDSGMMMLQYTAAALVLENQGLASPASVRSLPTSADQEDHNPNAASAARDLTASVANLERILAIELVAATQAVWLRLRQNPAARLGAGSQLLYQRLLPASPPVEEDQPLGTRLEAVGRLLRDPDALTGAAA